MEVSKDKKFQVLLNKCYHFVRFTRLFAELNLSKNLFANRSAIKTQIMTIPYSADKNAFTNEFMKYIIAYHEDNGTFPLNLEKVRQL